MQKLFNKIISDISIVPKLSIIFIVSISVIFLFYLEYLLIIYPSKESTRESDELEEELPMTGSGGDHYRVFVTSQTYTGDMGGLNGADNICNSLAQSENLGGAWRAWLSTSTVNARDRIRNTAYYLVDCYNPDYPAYQVCSDINDLTDGDIQFYIWRDETGWDLPLPPPYPEPSPPDDYGSVWTGTQINGSKCSAFSDELCYDWTSASSSLNSYTGLYFNRNYTWTENVTRDCSKAYHIYCFEYYKDRDSDGYNENDDCDDANSTVHPYAQEICDGLDNNCDGTIPSEESDNDSDGYRTCSDVYGDCNDNDGDIHPGAYERCNGLDDNCDGYINSSERDIDGDGYRGCRGDCNDLDASINVAADEVCDGVDNDCDGNIDDGLTRRCGTNIGICTRGYEFCISGSWSNCDGQMPRQEVCDGLDNDCDGTIDEDCSCNSGDTQSCGTDTGDCRQGTQWCENGVWGQCHGAIGPSFEVCDDRDNDCDGELDENLSKKCGSNLGNCSQGIQYCTSGIWGDCEGGSGPQTELCDGEDNDCNGTVDEGCSCSSGEERDCGVIIGECDMGTQKCIDGIWSECIGSKDPSSEICDDLDNDCDGEVDEGYVCEEEENSNLEIDSVTETDNEAVSVSRTDKKFLNIIKRIGIVILICIIVMASVFIGLKLIRNYKEMKKERVLENFTKGKVELDKGKADKSPLA